MSSRGRPFQTVWVDGHEILVGRGDSENDALTFDVAKPEDFWLHVSGFAGSHVVVRNPEAHADWASLPPAVRRMAAELAVWYSKARQARGKLEVHLCRAADVRKSPGLAPGEVHLRRWESVKLYPPKSAPGPGD